MQSKSVARRALERKYEPSWRKIGADVYWLSIPDVKSRLFENIWPIPQGINYNAYLVGSEGEYLLIDSSKKILPPNELVDLIRKIVDPNRIKHIAILHTEPDHSGLIEETSRQIGSPKLYSMARASTFMKKLFNIEPAVLKDGESLKVGKRALRVIELPWTHWPDAIFLYLEDEGILFTSDAFGAFGALEKPLFDDEVDFSSYLHEANEYFATVLVSYRRMLLHDLEKVKKLGIDVRMIAPAHGIVLRSKIQEFTQDLTSLCTLKKKRKIVVVYGSMYGFTERLAGFASQVLKERVEQVVLHNAVEDDINDTLTDIVNSAGVVFMTPTYESDIFPPVNNLLELLKLKKLGEGKHAVALVTRLWGGKAPALVTSKLKEAGYSVFEPVGDYMNYPSEQELKSIRELLLGFAGKALEGL